MSIPVRQPVKIHLNWGQFRGLTEVKEGLAGAISAAFLLAINDVIKLMVEVVPESAANKQRYEPKTKRRRKKTKFGSGYSGYLARRAAGGDPESLLDTALDILEDERKRLSKLTGADIGRLISVKFGYPSGYAMPINLKRKVTWSKGSSKTGFFGLTKQLLISRLRIYLKTQLAKPESQRLKLTKYIGVISTG